MGSAAAGQEQGKVPVDKLPGGGLHFPGKPPLHGAGKALGIEAAKKEKKKTKSGEIRRGRCYNEIRESIRDRVVCFFICLAGDFLLMEAAQTA